MIHTTPSTSSERFAGVNLACGGKLCREAGWVNADHSPSTKEVVSVDLLRRLPFADGSFDVVYHSQFIEHLPQDKALSFMKECHRILKPNGVVRVVTPDLKNQALEYLRNLERVLEAPGDEAARLRYEWIRLEMLDQLTRHHSGGDMVDFLKVSGRQVGDYLWERMGRSGKNLIPSEEAEGGGVKLMLRTARDQLRARKAAVTPMATRVGRFRLSGESHLCMYDEYLLSKLLREAGFGQVRRVGAKDSRIPGWDRTHLDCDAEGHPDGDASLFMEAAKQA